MIRSRDTAGHVHPRRKAWCAGFAGLLVCGCLGPVAARDQAPAAARCAELLPDIYDRVSPAVVSINATSINPYRVSDRVSRVAGSGLIVDSAGLILTNSHVAFRRQSITVTLDDGSRLPATLVGADPISDLAVLRIPLPSEGVLPTALLGDSDRLRVGEDVVAIGNPLGLEQTLTRGVVSAINRILPDTPFSPLGPLIQTDAPINPGNSGGPLVNRCGEVVGINTAVITDAQNIGFAVPSNLVRVVLLALVADGRVVRPWLGFHGQVVGTGLRSLLRLPLVDGLLVEVIEPGSPAEAAGLRGGRYELQVDGHTYLIGGDVITNVNEHAIDTPDALGAAMPGLQVGSTIRLKVFRDGNYHEIKYVLPERPLLPEDVVPQRSLAPAARRPPGSVVNINTPRHRPPPAWPPAP